MHAVVLAGAHPAALTPLDDTRTALTVAVEQAALHGVERFTVVTAPGDHAVRDRLDELDGALRALVVDLVDLPGDPTDRPLAAIRALADRLPEQVLVVPAHTLSDLDGGALLRAHLAARRLLTLAVHEHEEPARHDLVELDGDHLVRYRRRPATRPTISTGTFAISPGLVRAYPSTTPLTLERVVTDLTRHRDRPGVHRHLGHWLDLRDPATHDLARARFAADRGRYLPTPAPLEPPDPAPSADAATDESRDGDRERRRALLRRRRRRAAAPRRNGGAPRHNSRAQRRSPGSSRRNRAISRAISRRWDQSAGRRR